jgi:hypothetical protein
LVGCAFLRSAPAVGCYRLGIRKTAFYESFIKVGRLRFVKIGARPSGVIEDELDASRDNPERLKSLRRIMKPILKNGSTTGTASKKASRRPRWLGPLLEDPMYRRMRKALIREIAPDMALDWIEAEEYVMSQYQSMLFRDWQKVIWERCQWDGIKGAVKRRLRQRCPSDSENELDWKAGQLWPTMATSIKPAEIEVETFLARQPDLDSIARRSATALRRRDAALRHIEQRAE